VGRNFPDLSGALPGTTVALQERSPKKPGTEGQMPHTLTRAGTEIVLPEAGGGWAGIQGVRQLVSSDAAIFQSRQKRALLWEECYLGGCFEGD
jgi:hypothetical protein